MRNEGDFPGKSVHDSNLASVRSAWLLLTHIKFNLCSYQKQASPARRDLVLRWVHRSQVVTYNIVLNGMVGKTK